MGKVIKVIDLLNMIAKGEDLPKKIKWDGVEFYLKDRSYKHFEEEDCITEDFADYLTLSMLNEEVEILNEEDEIDIQNIPELDIVSRDNGYNEYAIGANRQIINNLVKAVKQLDNKLKEK